MDAVPMLEAAPMWQQVVYMVITALVAAFLLPYLTRKAQAAKEEIAKLKAEETTTSLAARTLLLKQVKAFLLDRAFCIAEKEFPKLAADILANGLSRDVVKNRLHVLGGTLRGDAILYFKNQGLDLLAVIGDEWLDKLIESAANRVSPFPGKESAVELVKDKYSNLLIEKGVDWVRENYLTLEGPPGE